MSENHSLFVYSLPYRTVFTDCLCVPQFDCFIPYPVTLSLQIVYVYYPKSTVCLFYSLPCRTVFTDCLSVLSYLSCTMQFTAQNEISVAFVGNLGFLRKYSRFEFHSYTVFTESYKFT